MSEDRDGATGDADGASTERRLWGLTTIGVLGVALLGFLVVGGALLVWAPATGCACEPPGPGVEVDTSQAEGTVIVSHVRDVGWRNLTVRTSASAGSVAVTDTTGGATVTDDGVRLPDVGDTVTFTEADRETETVVTVRVVATGEDGDSTTVLERTVEL